MNRLILPCVLAAALAAPCLATAATPSLLSAQPAMMLATSADISLAAISENPANTILHQVSANTALLEAGTQAITLTLEPGVELAFERVAAETFADGSLVWQGRLDAGASWSDAPAGADDYALLVRNGGMLTGDIRHGGKVYEIRPLHTGGHVVYTQDPSMLPMDDQDALRPMDSAASVDQTPATAADGAIADVLVLFARNAAARYPDITGHARLLIAQMNKAFTDSNIDGGVRLAADKAFAISYTESGNQGTDLNRLTYKDGQIDHIHQMREVHKADLVTLLIHEPNGMRFSCGVAWSNVAADWAFSVTQADCVSNFVFTHEIAHNYGAGHERGQGQNPYYGYGHGYQHPRGDWGTVMSYPCNFGRRCPTLLRWSSPLLSYQGAVTGTPNTEDNRRVINQRKEVMAGFR
ncbi:M12 family metallo-peptidase [Pinirhizobacter sp.]|jgi:phosphatidylethanolamine-binding protein (PEBP) family uncharacterized protein|uniref:M12 family metallo-peptidase n=1 Tax=Pinirhizobacter sp. TaxID=2950432 RepID=UPI002F3ED966